MKYLAIVSLFICSILFSADDDVFVRPKLFMPIRQRSIMNQDWMHVKECAPQEKKNQLLYGLARAPCADSEYWQRRKEIAAAIFAGADVPLVQNMLKECESCLLPMAVFQGDVPLVHLLLLKNAYVHESDAKGERAICFARTVDMALLLIKHRALKNLTEAEKCTIFQKAMQENYDPSLILLYQSHGFNPALWQNRGMLLLYLVRNPGQDIVKKAELMLQKMAPENILSIISDKKTGSSKTIFNEIELKTQSASPGGCARLRALHTFLSSLIECSVCFEYMDTTSYEKTPCGHMFHEKCLQNWKKQCAVDRQNNCIDCPICRACV